ncbi:retrotransposon protein, putative, ty1-copia subclass [Tanacetum coccineum]
MSFNACVEEKDSLAQVWHKRLGHIIEAGLHVLEKQELFSKKSLWYLKGVKGYRLYRPDNESPKIVTSRNVVFNESVMYKDTLKDSGAGTSKFVEELQVQVELQGLNNHYQLVRDRESRTIMKPLRFRDESNMVAYAFAAAEKEDTHEPLTYQEAIACEDISK